MPHSIRLSRLRALGAAALVFALAGCGDSDSFNPESSTTPHAVDQGPSLDGSISPVEAQPVASASYAGGIPFGNFAQPTSAFGSVYNGAHRNLHANHLLQELSAIRARGGKVALKLSGGDRYYKDAAGNFSLSKWKARVDLSKNVNLASYINDGTIIGHYLIDEPQDAANWNGRPISPAIVEEMAKHSKDRWPGMATIVRSSPDYLDSYNGNYRYLDAAWAQYAAHRWPNAQAFLEENVNKARNKGLALVVGLNTIKGSPNKGSMSASQVKAYGSALLSSTYPCAFLSWQYRSGYNTSGSIKEAMSYLRNKAENRSTKSCRAP